LFSEKATIAAGCGAIAENVIRDNKPFEMNGRKMTWH